MTQAPLLELDHVSLMYRSVMGVNDLQLTLSPGAYALVGPNGAGKSTLIGLLTGALRPTIGRVQIFGQDPVRSPGVLQRIGFCPASDLLVQGVSSKRWLLLQLAMSGWSRADAELRTDEVLELVGLQDARRRPIHTYSLGMRQRCKLAQAIAHRPDLLILDEPFNGLDPVGRFQIGEMLVDWTRSGKSLLLASHVLHEVERITDSFMLIFGGRLLASGTTGELRQLLADLPQEISVHSPNRDALAVRLSSQPWLRSMRRDHNPHRLVLTVERPLELFRCLAQWSAAGEVLVERVTGADGDISTLFRILVSKHRGESMLTSAGAVP